MHYLVVSCSVVAYLSANVYAIVKVRVLELARSRKHLLLYGVPFVELSHPIGMQAHGDHAPIRRVGCVIAHGDDFLRTELQKTQLTTESALSTPDTCRKATCSRFDDSRPMRSLSGDGAHFQRLISQYALTEPSIFCSLGFRAVVADPEITSQYTERE